MTTTSKTLRRTIPTSMAFGIAIVSMIAFFLAAGAPTPLLIVDQQAWGFSSWLLTLAFGIYAISLLGTLVTAGRLSDYVGRRPVLLGALILETIALLVMLAAPGIVEVIVGRFLQGIATGAATSAISSAIVELAPARARTFANSVVSAAPAAGLGLGALIAGALTSIAPNANTLIWASLASITTLGAIAVLAFPETGTPKPGGRASLRPSIAVPANASRIFRGAVPTLIAAWMMAALFMGLVPTTLGADFNIHSTFVDGAISFLEPAAAAIATLLTSRVSAARSLRVAGIATTIGALGFLAGLITTDLTLIGAAGIVGGIGFGTAVGGTIRATVPVTAANQRAGVFAAIYTVSYLAFGLPAIISGVLISIFGLTPVVIGFVAAIALVAGAGILAASTTRPRPVHAACAA